VPDFDVHGKFGIAYKYCTVYDQLYLPKV